MRPTTVLMNEHRRIERVLDCLDRLAGQAAASDGIDAESARSMIEFFRRYADACHHGKEEALLFPAMERRGFPPDTGPVGVMRAEHVEGRALVGAMERAVESGDASGFVGAARSFSRLLRAHIAKEDECLFPMADQALGSSEQAELMRRFEETESDPTVGGDRERLERLADLLAERFGVPLAEPAHGGRR